MSWLPAPTPSPEQQDQFPALGFVPCPGDPASADHVAQVVRETATSLGDVAALIRGTGTGSAWRGRSAEAFRDRFDDEFLPKVEDAHESFRRAAGALEEWAQFMAERQSDASALEREAEAERTALGAAEDTLAGLPPGFLDTDEADDEAREEAERDRDRASDRLDDVRARAQDLAERYQERGEEIAERLQRALDIAPSEPGLFDRLADAVDGLVTMASAVGRAVIDFVVEHADKLAAFGDLMSLASAIFGAVSMGLYALSPLVPVLTPFAIGTSIASAGFAILAFAGHSIAKAAGADVDNRSLIQDLLGVAPFGEAFRNGGALYRIGTSWPADALSGFGLLDSWSSIIQSSGTTDTDESSGPPSGDALLQSFDESWESAGDVTARV